MLGEPEYNMNELFAQLGLDSSDEAINRKKQIGQR